MKKLLMILTVIVFFAACKNDKTEKKEEGSKKVEAKTDRPESDIVEINAAQMKAVGIETDTLKLKDLTATVKANGILTVPNQNKALVTSVTNGVIKTLLVQPGKVVYKGQVIATIINPDVAQIQRELQTTVAQINLAEIEQTRQKELTEGNAAPLKNLQRINTELQTLRATRNALQQQLTTMGISLQGVNNGIVTTTLNVLAPINGTISDVMAQIGSNVDASTPIARIVNNSQLHLDVFVYEKDLPKIRNKQIIHFTLTNMQDKEYDAEVYSIGAAFANDTKTIPVHAVVKGGKNGLIDGMNITAIISTSTVAVPALPTDAIVTSAGQDYIFIESNPIPDTAKSGKNEKVKHFKRIPVSRGVSDVGFTQVILVNSMRPGTKIVTKGAFFVSAKMSNKGDEE